MNATDELRRLLDERGAEWRAEESELDHVTTWNANGGQAMFYESKTTNPNLLQVNYYDLTPEQAVEATLGSEAEVENTWLKETYGYLSGMFEAEVAENAKLRELVRGLDYCAHEAYGMCARVPVGGVRPFTCCPLFDFDSGEYGCKKLMRELGVDA